MSACPMSSRLILCPHCQNEVEVTPWRDGRTIWFQCRYCGYYDTLEDDTE